MGNDCSSCNGQTPVPSYQLSVPHSLFHSAFSVTALPSQFRFSRSPLTRLEERRGGIRQCERGTKRGAENGMWNGEREIHNGEPQMTKAQAFPRTHCYRSSRCLNLPEKTRIHGIVNRMKGVRVFSIGIAPAFRPGKTNKPPNTCRVSTLFRSEPQIVADGNR